MRVVKCMKMRWSGHIATNRKDKKGVKSLVLKIGREEITGTDGRICFKLRFKIACRMWARFIWLRTGSSSVLLWTLGCIKTRGFTHNPSNSHYVPAC
jgi:hypothetical protein